MTSYESFKQKPENLCHADLCGGEREPESELCSMHKLYADKRDAEYTKLRAVARALWSVRVLDAGEEQGVAYELPAYGRISQRWWLRAESCPTAAAARYAAALAVFPSLDRNAPNWPGECP